MYYYNPNYRSRNFFNKRFVPGGFILPFALGFLSAPLVLPPKYYPQPYYGPTYYY